MSPPVREHSRGLYAEETLFQELSTTQLLENYHAWIFEEMQPYLGKDITELGGGLGAFSEILIHNYIATHDDTTIEIFEPAGRLFPHLRQQCQAKYDHLLRVNRVRLTHTEFPPQTDTYDSAVLVNVLEHIEDDSCLIQQLYASLRRRGTLIVFSPALPCLYSALDRQVGHFRRYTKQLLANLFTNAGFAIAKLQYIDIAGIVPWYVINVLGGSCSFNPSLVKAYDSIIVPIMRHVEQYCGAPIGKNILIVGRKL